MVEGKWDIFHTLSPFLLLPCFYEMGNCPIPLPGIKISGMLKLRMPRLVSIEGMVVLAQVIVRELIKGAIKLIFSS